MNWLSATKPTSSSVSCAPTKIWCSANTVISQNEASANWNWRKITTNSTKYRKPPLSEGGDTTPTKPALATLDTAEWCVRKKSRRYSLENIWNTSCPKTVTYSASGWYETYKGTSKKAWNIVFTIKNKYTISVWKLSHVKYTKMEALYWKAIYKTLPIYSNDAMTSIYWHMPSTTLRKTYLPLTRTVCSFLPIAVSDSIIISE